MCGITGFVDFNNNSSQEIVAKMSTTMQHRGPDGQSEFFEQKEDYQVGLGHRRLSIIDLSHAADQPMVYLDWIIVFNGEIYNYNEIKEELISLGHNFTTHSDTEIILHSWQQWGRAAIKKWRGMFAIALYNKKSSDLLLIRDRAGVKPLYYSFAEGLFIFGSELKTLMAHPHFKKEMDTDVVATFLQYGYVPAPYSIFAHTFKLHPGHILHLDLKTQNITIDPYWNVYDYYNKPKLKISLLEAIEETERVLKESFDYRMVADVPVGVFLSGGYDSTCVTALLQQDRTDVIKTFTIGVADQKLNEAPFAKEIANRLGTDHTEQYCTIEEALAIIPDLPDYYDEPFADSSAIPTILVSRMAKQKVTVALSADGGDEIFAGYNRYDYIKRYGQKIARTPKLIRKLMLAGMTAVPSEKIPLLRDKANFHSRYKKLKNLLDSHTVHGQVKNMNVFFSNAELKELMANNVEHIKTGYNSTELLYDDALDFMMAIDYQTYMADDILQKVDRATMSVSLEGREPFLDQHIIEWAAQLPSSFKYNNGIKKYMVRQIVHKYIPLEMMDRPKMGFGIPVKDWLQKELKPYIANYLDGDALNKHQLFNADVVKKIITDFEHGRSENYLQIWHLLMFQMWYERWVN